MKLDGRFWLSKDGKNFLGSGRIELLEQIEKTGSMNAAAKAMKMSYKAAWERVNGMNALADYPIIKKMTGGKGGGGTVLTPYAYELMATFRRFEELHSQFIERFAQAGDDPERLARILGRTFLTTSARNQLLCSVISIEEQGVKGSIKLQLSGGELAWADITIKSIRSMGLVKGCKAYAIIKSSDVHIYDTLPQDDDQLNIFKGRVTNIESADKNTEVTFVTDGGETLVGLISLQESNLLQKDNLAYACVAKRHIIIGL